VRISLEASFSSTRGAGGFSISPRLEFRAIVPTSSEIFLALSRAEDNFKSQDVSVIIQDTQKTLFELIRGGKASISDALGNGDTILHVSKDLLCILQAFTCPNNLLVEKLSLLVPELELTITTGSDKLATLQFSVGHTFTTYLAFIYQQNFTDRVVS
jgi:hypothetical protein